MNYPDGAETDRCEPGGSTDRQRHSRPRIKRLQFFRRPTTIVSGDGVKRVGEVTRILDAMQQGDPSAAEELLPLVYDELRRLAAHKMAGEAPGQTLQATALVHEAWLRLMQGEEREWNGSRHFFYAAAEAMRRILIENARRKQRLKHGGQMQRVDLEDIALASPMKPDELLAVDEVLERLATEDPDAARLVKLRFFAGLSHQEAAEIMGLTRRAADGLWAYAKTWLFEALRHESVMGCGRPAEIRPS